MIPVVVIICLIRAERSVDLAVQSNTSALYTACLATTRLVSGPRLAFFLPKHFPHWYQGRIDCHKKAQQISSPPSSARAQRSLTLQTAVVWSQCYRRLVKSCPCGNGYVGLLYDKWRHHRSPPLQIRHGTGEVGDILQPPACGFSCDHPQDFRTH
ncbi:hypothetical protein TNCV_3209001 [Trichonephila clavipes]|nr:hypothetical protein TNCV_3209001 [Trichonephila clavipes]